MLFGPIQSAESVSASPHTYFKPNPFPSHFFAPYTWAHAVITRIRPRYLDIWKLQREKDTMRTACLNQLIVAVAN